LEDWGVEILNEESWHINTNYDTEVEIWPNQYVIVKAWCLVDLIAPSLRAAGPRASAIKSTKYRVPML